MMFILVFGVRLQWLPYTFAFGPSVTPSFSLPFIGNALEHAVMPAAALLITTIGTWILIMRNTMISTLAEDDVISWRRRGCWASGACTSSWWRSFPP